MTRGTRVAAGPDTVAEDRVPGPVAADVDTAADAAPGTAADPARDAGAVRVQVLVCGTADRGDDGAALVAAARLADRLPSDARLRLVGGLDIDDLLAVPAGAAVVIVDAATGIPPGRIVELALSELSDLREGPRPRSSHTLALRDVVGLADLLRGSRVRGRIVVIGGKDFRLGSGLSAPVVEALPAFVATIAAAIERHRG
jgi:hydrogenase maturation protease